MITSVRKVADVEAPKDSSYLCVLGERGVRILYILFTIRVSEESFLACNDSLYYLFSHVLPSTLLDWVGHD
jgi:hypothetical protein